MSTDLTPAELRGRVRDALPGLIAFRHALHRIPEPAFREYETARLLRERAAGTRLRMHLPLAETDTVGVLDGRAPGRCVLLRADIDALPMEDQTGTPYASVHPGWTHACGHDGHAAMLMGALEVLDGLVDRFDGHVLFVFQPAEEERGGGRELIRLGLLDRPPVPRAAFALHGWPGLVTGRIASRPGVMMAAQDRFSLRISGRGGHGAQPHQTIDPVVLAAQIILAFQTIPARMINPLRPAVLSVCTVQGGTASNVIPDEVVLTGTVRHLDSETRDRIHASMHRVVQGLAGSAGATCALEIVPGYPATMNDPGRVAFAEEVVRRNLGGDAWETLPDPSMGAEDFAYYLDRVPGAMLRIGVGEGHAHLHNPAFDFEDAAIEHGVLALVSLALEMLVEP